MEHTTLIHLDHRTRYHYPCAVGFGDHRLLLYPRGSPALRIDTFTVECDPPATIRWVNDCFENTVALASFQAKQPTLEVRCTMDIRLSEHNPYDFLLESRAVNYPFNHTPVEKQALHCHLGTIATSDAREVLSWYCRIMPDQPRETSLLLSQLNRCIYEQFRYVRRDDPGVQTPDETLRLQSGACRDLAWLFIAVTRQLGFASRFVSGYIAEPDKPDASQADNRAQGSMHAWAEVYLPGAGWKGYDPTNGILATSAFVATAVSDHPGWANPIQGTYLHPDPQPVTLDVDLKITSPSAHS
jgi:transglutaminase-like putative cysteine protease